MAFSVGAMINIWWHLNNIIKCSCFILDINLNLRLIHAILKFIAYVAILKRKYLNKLLEWLSI